MRFKNYFKGFDRNFIIQCFPYLMIYIGIYFQIFSRYFNVSKEFMLVLVFTFPFSSFMSQKFLKMMKQSFSLEDDRAEYKRSSIFLTLLSLVFEFIVFILSIPILVIGLVYSLFLLIPEK